MSEVLIVDDDRNFRETLRELLSDAGYQTLVAMNAEDALTLLQTAAASSAGAGAGYAGGRSD